MIEFGYKIENGQILVDEINGAAVKKIHEIYLSEKSMFSVLGYLAASEFFSPGGKKNWTRSTVRKILGNEIYKGNDLFPRILPDEIVDQVNEIFDSKNSCRNSNGILGSELIITNIKCAKCGIQLKPSRKNKEIYECKCLSLPLSFVKEAFMSLIEAVKEDPSLIEHFENTVSESKEIKQLTKRIEEAMAAESYSHFNVISLLKERASLAYQQSTIDDSEIKSMKILNRLMMKENTEEFDLVYYGMIVKNILVFEANLIQVELINGQCFEFTNEV